MTSTQSPDDLCLRAAQADQAGHLGEAETLYRQVLALSPGHLGALRGLADLARRHGAYDAALELLRAALRAAPRVPDLHVQMGQVRFDQQQYGAATAACEMALALQPDHGDAVAGLAAAREAMALAGDPDYSATAQSLATDGGVLEEPGNHATLLVLFAGLGVGRAPPAFIFRKFLAGYPADKLFLRDLSLSWYLKGIPGVSCDVPSTLEFLRRKTGGYRRRVFVGCSAGATAAIRYGQLLGVDKVLAFAPQTILSERKPQELQDRRWERRLARLRAEFPDVRLLDMAGLGALTVPVDVYYPAGIAVDCRHAEALDGPAVARFPQPGSSHLVALAMRDQGLLGPVIRREIEA